MGLFAIQNMSLTNENTLKTEHFMPLDHFSNFSNFQCTKHFMWFWCTFSNAKTRGVDVWIWHFWASHFNGNVKTCILVGFGFGNTIKKWQGLDKTSTIFVVFSEFHGISYFPVEKYLFFRSYIMKNIVLNNIEEMSGNSICPEPPRNHPGNTWKTPRKGAFTNILN